MLLVDNVIINCQIYCVFLCNEVLFCIYICCWALPLLIYQSSSKLMLQFPLKLLVNYWGDVFDEDSKHEKGNESRRICPKALHGRGKQMMTQRRKLGGKDGRERERAEIEAEKKNGRGR